MPLDSVSLQGIKGDQAHCRVFGQEGVRVFMLEEGYSDPQSLLEQAQSKQNFEKTDSDYYPGVKLELVSQSYRQHLVSLADEVAQALGIEYKHAPRIDSCCFAMTNVPADQLLPIQRIPHFDTTDPRQIAVVHYLCEPALGGTSFYRHRATGYERISPERRLAYQQCLSHQATSEGLPPPTYINGDTPLFKRIGCIDAAFNRVIFYPSNVLHSGNIQHLDDGDAPAQHRRLTITSNLVFD